MNFMPEDEVITPATETPEIVDIQIVEHSRSDAASDRSYMEAVNNDFKGINTETAPVENTENKDAATENTAAAENTNVEPEKKVIETPAPVNTDTPDVFSTIKEKFGREIDEDYLTTDYKAKATDAEQQLADVKEQAEKFKHIFENPTLLQIADLMKAGNSATDILESLSIDVEKIPSDQLILDYIKREKPFLDEEDLQLFAEQNFGLGEDLEDLRRVDPARYFQFKENIEKAVSGQKQYLNEKKVTLVTPTAQSQDQVQPEATITVDKVKTFKDTFNQHVNSLKDFQVATEFSKPFDKDALKLQSDKIVYSGDLNGNKVLMLSGIDDKTVLEALYLHNQKQALFDEFKTKIETSITENKSIEAFQKVSDIYNNVQGAGQQAGGDNTNLEIAEVKNQRGGGGW
jgi:hypothetical protein